MRCFCIGQKALKIRASSPRRVAKSPPNVLAYILPSIPIHSCLMTKLQVKWSVEVFKCFGLRSFRVGYFPDTEEVRSSNLLTPTKCSQPRGLASRLFCFGRQTSRQIRHQILNCLIFRNASQRLSVGTLKSFTCIQESFIDLRLGRMGPAGRDRNMLVKHNLLDSFGANGLVLVGFVGDLTKGVSKLPCR